MYVNDCGHLFRKIINVDFSTTVIELKLDIRIHG